MKAIILFGVFVLCAFGDCQNATTCSIYDSECQKDYFQNVGIKNAYTGIPALGVPVIDPFKVTNVTLSILGLLKLTLIEGDAVGIGKCIVTKFETNVKEKYRRPEMVCDKIIIKGHYRLSSSEVVGKTCAWCEVHGEGNGTITLENWSFKFQYPIQLIKQKNGKIYLNALFEKAVYEADVEKVTVEADSIKLGRKDITQSITRFINNNWRQIMNSEVGKYINDKSAQYYYDIYKIFFDRVPTEQYFSDDLSALVDKDNSY